MSVETPATPAPAVAAPVAAPVVAPDGAKPDEPLGAPGLAALQSERARANAAEKAVSDAQARIQAFEDRDKTEAQKAADRIAAMERENASLRVDALRAQVAAAKSDAAKGIILTADLLTGSTQAELEASADRLLAFKGTPQVTPEPAAQSASFIIPDDGGKPAIGKQNDIQPGLGTLRAAYAQVK